MRIMFIQQRGYVINLKKEALDETRAFLSVLKIAMKKGE